DEFLPLEPLAPAVLLDDHVRDFIDPFVAGEAPAAFETLAAAANDFALLALARVDDLVAQMTAVWTFHERSASVASAFMFLNLPSVSPSCHRYNKPRIVTGTNQTPCSTIAA